MSDYIYSDVFEQLQAGRDDPGRAQELAEIDALRAETAEIAELSRLTVELTSQPVVTVTNS